MPDTIDGERICQADGSAPATDELHIVELASASVCEAGAVAGLCFDDGEQICSASGVASAEDEEMIPCVASGVVTFTDELHIVEDVADSICQAAGVATAVDFVGDPSSDRWELYHSTDGVFDFDSPLETWTSPGARQLTTSTFGDGTHWFVVRKRNQWGFTSQNINPIRVKVSGSQQVMLDPSTPLGVALTQDGSIMRLSAKYYAAQDGDARANQWLVYLTTDGSDPTLATPVVIDMSKAFRGANVLSYETGTLSGNLVQAFVKARRRENNGTVFDSVKTATVSKTHVLSAPTTVSIGGLDSFDPTV